MERTIEEIQVELGRLVKSRVISSAVIQHELWNDPTNTCSGWQLSWFIDGNFTDCQQERRFANADIVEFMRSTWGSFPVDAPSPDIPATPIADDYASDGEQKPLGTTPELDGACSCGGDSESSGPDHRPACPMHRPFPPLTPPELVGQPNRDASPEPRNWSAGYETD